MGLQDAVAGNIWLYKPVGWNDPTGNANAHPSVAIVSPADGAVVQYGQPVTINTSASDPDGSVAKVEFFAGATRLGESTAAPFSFVWHSPPSGTHTLTAMATDDRGAQTVSAPVTIKVQAGESGTLELQDGVNGYALTQDTYLSTYHRTLNFGAQATVVSQRDYYTDLFRFAIFAREGGPVPDGADIQSAMLTLYKTSWYDAVFSLNRMLVDWSQASATWSQRLPGVPWGAAGATAVDVDYRSVADTTGSAGWNPGYVEFDVTQAVRDFAGGQPNFGWRMLGVSGNLLNGKAFASREAADPTRRPKLTIIYSNVIN
jgi:hypothetical protein